MPGAPMIKYVEPHFNRPLGQWVNDAQDLERKQKVQGVFTPTKQDIEKAIDSEPITELRPQVDQERFKAVAEKTWSHLYNEHKVENFRPS